MEDQKSLSDHIYKLMFIKRIQAKNNSFNKFLTGDGILVSGGGLARGGGLPSGGGLDNSKFKNRKPSTQISMLSNTKDDVDFIQAEKNLKEIDSSVIVEYKEAEPIAPIVEEPKAPKVEEHIAQSVDKKDKPKKSNKPIPAEKDDKAPEYDEHIIYYIS